MRTCQFIDEARMFTLLKSIQLLYNYAAFGLALYSIALLLSASIFNWFVQS
jgi:hypothetical protein